MTRDTGTTSDFRLEQYHLEELPVDEAARITQLAATDADLRARLAALAQSDAEIRNQYPGDGLGRTAVERAELTRRTRRPGVAPRWVALAGAGALLVAAAIWLPTRPAQPGNAADGIRIKGDAASLVVYRRAGSGSAQLADGDAARRGDLVRLAYRCASPRFGVIVSIDGRGVVTRHLPVTGAAAAALQSGAMTLLDQAYELDDAPRWEQFVLITSETVFDVQTVLDAARNAVTSAGKEAPASLPLPKPFDQTSFLLRKIS